MRTENVTAKLAKCLILGSPSRIRNIYRYISGLRHPILIIDSSLES